MRYVKLTGSTSKDTNWTSEYVLEGSKTVRKGEPIKLTDAEISKLESIGAVFTDSSLEELHQYEESQPDEVIVGDDVAAGLPSLEVAGIDQPGPVTPDPVVAETPEAEGDKSTKPDQSSGSNKSNKQ